MSATQPELDCIAAVVSALRTGAPVLRKRLTRGVAVLLASADGRYLEQLDIHLSQLEQHADELKTQT